MASTKSPLPWVGLGLALVAVVGLFAWRALDDDPAPDTAAEAEATRPADTPDSKPSRKPRLDGLSLRSAQKASVRGHVVDESGRGIEGARVCALPDNDALEGAARVEPTCVLTDAAGAYELGGLWPVRSRLMASARGFEPKTWRANPTDKGRKVRIDLGPGLQRQDVDFELTSGGVSLLGVVKDIAGGPIEGAWVMRGSAHASTDEEGRFELWVRTGVASVTATSEGYTKGRVQALAPGEFVELFLTPESVLVGRVVDALSGEPVAGATVRSGRSSAIALSDDEGQFRIEGLEPGIYKPKATTDHGFAEIAEAVHLGLGETSEMVELRLHAMALIEGQVVVTGAEPTPCEDGWVVLRGKSGQRYRSATENGEGQVRLRGVMPGTYRVQVGCESTVPAQTYPELVVGQEDQLDLVWEVETGLAIRGLVVDEGGAPVEGVYLIARMVVSGDQARDQQQTSAGDGSNEDGSFEIDGLLAGSYELSTQAWNAARPGPTEPLELELGSADLDGVRVEMPTSGSVRGRIIDARGQPIVASLIATSVEGRGQSRTRSGDDGRFEFEHVRPGKTRVTAAEDGGWGSVVMRKPGTTDDDLQGEVVEVLANQAAEVELVVESRGGTIRGRVVDATSAPVPDAFIDVERMPDAAGRSESSARRSVRWSWGQQPVLTDEDGSFVLDELPEGQFILRAHRKGGGEALAEHVALGASVELVIADTGELAGTVMVAGGEPPELFTLDLREVDSGFRQSERFFRTEGAWRLTGLPAGRYEITVSAEGGAVEAEAELGVDEVREGILLTLQPRLTLEGRLVDLDSGEPVAGLSVMVGGKSFNFGTGDPERANISDSSGRFTVSEAPSGQVWFTAYAMGAGSKSPYAGLFKQMNLPAEPLVQDLGDIPVPRRRLGPTDKPGDLGLTLEEFDFMDAQADTRLVVAFVRPGGPAQEAGLDAGDEIVKCDGHAVGGLDAGRWYTLSRVVAGTELALTLADGRELTLVVGPPV